MLNTSFHYEKLAGMVSTMVSETDRLIDSWLASADVSAASCVEKDVHKDMSQLTFAIIAGCAFGAGFSLLPHAATTLQDNIVDIARLIQRRALTLVGVLPVVKWLPLWGRPTIDRLRREMFWYGGQCDQRQEGR